ncbi:MAG: YkgJ family cysteine cluster protein [bacterium]
MNKTINNKKPTPTCSMCGLCCKLFLINLNEEEYFSGKYQTVFDDIVTFDTFAEVEEAGAIFLKQKTDGSCIYLKDKKCSIHKNRPAVCGEFFCQGVENKFIEMRSIIKKATN